MLPAEPPFLCTRPFSLSCPKAITARGSADTERHCGQVASASSTHNIKLQGVDFALVVSQEVYLPGKRRRLQFCSNNTFHSITPIFIIRKSERCFDGSETQLGLAGFLLNARPTPFISAASPFLPRLIICLGNLVPQTVQTEATPLGSLCACSSVGSRK